MKRLLLGIISALLLMCSVQVYAEDDLKFDGFYEYDMQTGVEKEYSIHVPDQTADELILEGYAGEDAVEKTEKTSTVSRQYDSRCYRSKWVKRNGYWYYYNKNGKMLKKRANGSGVYKIKGSFYHFDKKGRRISKEYVDDLGFHNLFSARTGKMTKRYLPLKVTKAWPAYRNSYSFDCSNYKVKDKHNIGAFLIRVLKGKDGTKIVDKNGKKVDPSRIRKGSVLWVYATAEMTVLESAPLQIPHITKIVLMKR